MALFGALFATSMSTREADASETAGAMQRLSTQRAATYDDCETMRHGAHGCVSKTKLLHNGTSIDCHEVSNFALDYFCGDNHTNSAALAHMVNPQDAVVLERERVGQHRRTEAVSEPNPTPP